MGEVVQVACQGFLVREAWVGVLVGELDFFSLECNEVSSNELWDVYGFGVTLGSLYLGLRAVFLFCWRICLVCLTLELVGPCVVLGFSVGMEAFDELLLSKTCIAFLGAWCPLPAFRSCFVEFTRRLNALLMNLLGGESVLPILLLRHLSSSDENFLSWMDIELCRNFFCSY